MAFLDTLTKIATSTKIASVLTNVAYLGKYMYLYIYRSFFLLRMPRNFAFTRVARIKTVGSVWGRYKIGENRGKKHASIRH